eukprot:tig00021254_g19709.t1
MTGDGKRAIEASSELEDSKRARGLEQPEDMSMAPAAPAAAGLAEEEEEPIASLPDELLMKILRIVAKELPSNADFWNPDDDLELESEINNCQWPAALREAHALRAVCRRFKAEIDAAGGPLALFEEANWEEGVERWLAGRGGGVDAFLAKRAPLLTGPPSLARPAPRCPLGLPAPLGLRIPPPAPQVYVVDDYDDDEYSEEASALLGAIVRRCTPSLRALRLHRIAVEGRWEDLLPTAGLRELRLTYPPRPVALGGLERGGAAATLETVDVYGGDLFAGRGGRDSALALAALPALSSLTIGVDVDASLCSPAPPPPPAGSFPALRSLSLSGRFTRSDWWAAVLASPAGARLESLSLRRVGGAGGILATLDASGPPLALRALSLDLFGCSFGGGAAPRLEGLLAACPALRELDISSFDELLKRTEAASMLMLLARLPALERLTMRDSVHREACTSCSAGATDPELPSPPAGSFPALRVLELGSRSRVRVDWWTAALAPPVGARLQSLSLEKVPEAWRILGALGASGPALALRSLSVEKCRFRAEEAPRLAGLLAACPAVRIFVVRDCPEISEFLAGGGDAEASGPRLLRKLEARGVHVFWRSSPPPSPDNADIGSEDNEDIESGYTSSAGGGAE